MKIIEIRDIIKKESPVLYRMEYSARVAYTLPLGQETEKPILFTLEMTPLGGAEIDVEFPDSIDYPVLQARKIIKDHLKELKSKGQLP